MIVAAIRELCAFWAHRHADLVGRSRKDFGAQLEEKIMPIKAWMQSFAPDGWKVEVGIGQGRIAVIPYVVALPPGQKVSNGLYVAFLLGKDGNGCVIGAAVSRTSKDSNARLMAVQTVRRENVIVDVDGIRENCKYNNVFVNPLERTVDQLDEEQLEEHVRESILKCQDIIESWTTSAVGLKKGGIMNVASQLVTYGAPGTGKSYKIDKCTNESNSVRVTFHPDTDYAAFVGAYKPTMVRTDKGLLTLPELAAALQNLKDRGETRPEQKLGAEFWRSFEKLTPADVKSILKDDSMYAEVMKGVAVGEYLTRIENGEKQIGYSFVPQAFMKAYVEAWRRYTNAGLQGDTKTYYLVIEEINRGNCAQIFGDLFQLLDRADNGFSAYAITPDDDIQKFLETDKDYKLADISLSEDIKKVTEAGEKVIATAADIKAGKKLVLPPNLFIWATMNTSDQSLFPMDSAFKRRWDWMYVPIKDAGKGWKIKFGDCEVDWWKFLVAINKIVKGVTNSADKQLGYFFVKAKDSVIDAEMFVNKVAFYLWNDVFKDCELDGDAFKITREGGEVDVLAFQDFFKEDGTINEEVLKNFLTKLVPQPEPENDAAPQAGTGA